MPLPSAEGATAVWTSTTNPVNRTMAKAIGIACLIPGVIWLFFAAMNYYTHVGSLVKHSGRF